MNFKLMLAGLAVAGAATVNAQSPQVSLGVDLALPLGDFGEAYSLGVGPAAGFELPVGDNLGITAQLSYQFLTVKSDLSDFVKSSSMLPVQVGAKYYFMDQQEGFYGHVQLGIHSTSVTTEDQEFTILGTTTTIEGETSSSTNFSWAIGAGYQLEKLDIGLRYNSISPDSDIEGAEASSYIGLRVAYLINVGG
ncbi:MAG: outer membrane beta-barrel protein [Flavobacteriales bacterium]